MLRPISKGVENLLALATELERVHEVYDENWIESGYFQQDVVHERGPRCGTPACAWGHYVHMRHGGFRAKQGFSRSRGGAIVFQWSEQMYRIQHEFELDLDWAVKIFGEDGCGGARTALEAATYIRAHVAQIVEALTPA